MAKFLFHGFQGSENPTMATFPFLQAVANKERGDDVQIALAGDAVVLIKDAVINSVVPVGWPSLKETFEKVLQHGILIHVWGGCSSARGVTEQDLAGKNARFVTFKDSAELYATMDKVFTYWEAMVGIGNLRKVAGVDRGLVIFGLVEGSTPK
jgi:predicted peroxiredoxin